MSSSSSKQYWSYVCRSPRHHMRLPIWVPEPIAALVARVWAWAHRNHRKAARP